MTAISQSSLLARWRHRFDGRRRNRAQPRPLTALGYLVNGAVMDGLVEIENLVLVVLYDEVTDTGQLALRLAGFGGARMPWGVKWGGADQSKFFKDLLLRPIPGARGPRLDAGRTKPLQLAMQLDRQLQRYSRRPWLVRRQRLRLPRLWAGFRASLVAEVTGDGPELAAEVHRTRKAASRLLEEARRMHEGLTLYPLPWVSHHEAIASAVFADLASFPRCQVFLLRSLPEDLQGFQGAAQFDLFSSRFRPSTGSRPKANADQLIMPVAV
jgi:hypothetical protein